MKTSLVTFSMLSLLLASSLSAQTIYKWKDEKGQWHFSQTPAGNTPGIKQIKVKQTPFSFGASDRSICQPFKAGETRNFKQITPSPDFPHLQLLQFQVRLVAATEKSAQYSWKILVQNVAQHREKITGAVILKDCDGFALKEEKFSSNGIEAGGETTVSGATLVEGPGASKVGSFSAGFGGLKPIVGK